MEFLKLSFVGLILLVSSLSFSQSNDAMLEAFSKSYELEADGKYEDAISKLLAVYNKDSYEVNIRLAWLNYMAGLFTESIPYYVKCIELKPLSIEARLGLTYPASALGNWTQVENAYNEILEIDPENSVALYRIGSIYYGKEDYSKALKYFERVLNHYPFDFSSLNMTAWTYFQMGDMRKAEVLFRKALLNEPNNEIILEGLSLIKR